MPELAEAEEGTPDIVYERCQIETPDSWPGRVVLESTVSGVKYAIRDLGSVIVGPDRIGVDPTDDPRSFRQQCLVPALGLAIHQRGFITLHASGVVINGQAVLFVGSSGMGKSTLLATMYERGHTVISDDMVAIAVPDSGSQPPVAPLGTPWLKLAPEFAESLAAPLDRLSAENDLEKEFYGVDRPVESTPYPVAGIYVLEQGSKISIDRLQPTNAVSQLLRHNYVALLGETLSITDSVERLFEQCAAIADTVPCASVVRGNDLASLPAVVQAVEQDVAATDSATPIHRPSDGG